MDGLQKACTDSISFKVHGQDVYLRHAWNHVKTSKYENDEQLFADASFIEVDSLSGSKFRVD